MPKMLWGESLRVSAIHFLITLIAASLAAALVFLIWFPGPFAAMVGGVHLFFLVIGCDLALGPLISLVIFNSKKSQRELVVDYSIVGVVQLVALIYGVSVIASSRPVFVAFTKDRFEVIAAIELDNTDLGLAVDDKFKSRSWWGPVTVAVKLPTDVKESTQLLFSAFKGKDAQLMPKYYRPYEAMIDEVKGKSLSLETLAERGQEKRKELDAAVKNIGHAPDDLRWLPVHHRFGFWTALIDAKTGYPIKYLPIDPY